MANIRRLKMRLDREPIWRRIEDQFDDLMSEVRNAPGRRLEREFPQFENRNFGGGLAVGGVEAGIALILKETVGLPLGSDVEVVDSEPAEGGTIYTVNVDSPTENMAQAQAFLESGTGFTSYLTDLIKVESTSVLRTRTVRDTYQVEILVED